MNNNLNCQRRSGKKRKALVTTKLFIGRHVVIVKLLDDESVEVLIDPQQAN